MKKMIAVLLLAVMILTFAVTVYAEDPIDVGGILLGGPVDPAPVGSVVPEPGIQLNGETPIDVGGI